MSERKFMNFNLYTYEQINKVLDFLEENKGYNAEIGSLKMWHYGENDDDENENYFVIKRNKKK